MHLKLTCSCDMSIVVLRIVGTLARIQKLLFDLLLFVNEIVYLCVFYFFCLGSN